MRRTDGRTVGRIRVYLATFPKRSGQQQALLRVLRSTATYIDIRLTALPGQLPLRRRFWTVARSDLDSMVTCGLAKPITTMTCSSCSGTMAIYNGHTKKRHAVVLACSDCEEMLEI